MKQQYSKMEIIASLFWKLMERGGTLGIQFIIQIILARLLSPDEYGLIALVMVFIVIASVFVQSGFSTALIQQKNADEEDFSSVLYFSLVIAALLYMIIYFSAPIIASFYNQPQLTDVLRVLSFTLFIGAFNSVQNAFIARNMLFKKLFISSLGAVVISGIVGIAMAYLGSGIWALVAQQLSNQLTMAIILWFMVKWKPRLLFSLEKLKTLLAYGSNLLMSSLIDTLYKDIRTLIIGKMYTPAMLGFYNKGKQFPQLIIENINGSIQTVMLPTLSAQQDNRKKVKEMMRRSIVTSSFVIFPMMIGMAVIADGLVKIVLTDKWLAAVPFLQISCFSYSLWPIHTANLQAINAMGRSDIYLKLETIKKIMGFIILVISLNFGVYAIAIGGAVSGIVSTFINSYPNKQLLNYSYKEQFVDIMPPFLLALFMGSIVYSLKFLILPVSVILFLQVTVGFLIYIALAKIFRMECFSYLVITIKQILKSRKESLV